MPPCLTNASVRPLIAHDHAPPDNGGPPVPPIRSMRILRRTLPGPFPAASDAALPPAAALWGLPLQLLFPFNGLNVLHYKRCTALCQGQIASKILYILALCLPFLNAVRLFLPFIFVENFVEIVKNSAFFGFSEPLLRGYSLKKYEYSPGFKTFSGLREPRFLFLSALTDAGKCGTFLLY